MLRSKLMGLGIPIICNKGIGDVDSIIRKYNSGVSIDLKNYDLENILKKQYKKKSISKNASFVFSLNFGINEYFKTYKSILGWKKFYL